MNPQIKMLNAVAKQRLPAAKVISKEKETDKVITELYSKSQMLEMFRIGYEYAKIHG